MTGQDLCYDAALEIGAVGLENPLTPASAAFILRKANRILDNWNADRDCVWATDFTTGPNPDGTFTLIANHQPHTIGPAGDFNVTQRPVSIEDANVVITTSPTAVNYPVTVHKSYGAWWAAQRVQALKTSYPIHAYYAADWPLGNLWLWPIPTNAYHFQVFMRNVLASLTLAGAVSVPPGVQDALVLTLAEDIASAFNQPVPPQLIVKAAQARQRAFSNNRETPLLSTRDSGMPTGSGTYLNWQTGLMAK